MHSPEISMKQYHEQKYPIAIKIRITISGGIMGQTWVDGIKGLNVGHAMHLAHKNWDNASKIEFLGILFDNS